MTYAFSGQLDGLPAGLRGGRLSGSGPSMRISGSYGRSAAPSGLRDGRDPSADHIVWGTVESSTGSLEDSSFTDPTTKGKSKQHLIEDVLLMGSDNSYSEHMSDLQRSLELSGNCAKEGETKHDQKAANHGRQLANLDAPLEEEEDQDEEQMPHQVGALQAKQLLINQGLNVEHLVEQVPRNERGFPTSIGSIGHYNQRCKEVCAFIHRPKGCANGVYCNSCHFSHGLRKRKVKDGKSKRDRYRKLKEDMMNQIEASPDDFNFHSTALPECIAKDERLKGKLMNRLKIHQDQVKKKLVDL